MKKTFVFAIAIMFAFSLSAQKFGIKAGMNVSGYTTNFNTPDESKMGIGGNAGIFGEYEFSDLLSLRASLDVNDLGSDSYEEEDGNSMSIRNNVEYINLTVTPKVNVGPAYLFAGPYLGYATSYHTKVTYKGTNNDGDDRSYQRTENNFFNDEDKDFYNRIDFGLNLGVGTKLSGIIIEFNVGYGLTNFFNTDSEKYKDYEEITDDLNALLALSNAADINIDLDDWGFYNDGETFVAPIQKNLFFGLSIGTYIGKK